jgi:PAS domain S-box-containing protein
MAEHDTSRSDPTDSVTGGAAIGTLRSGATASRSELRFRTLFERAGVGMAEIDPQWRIVSANAAYCRIAGRGLDELLGESCLAFTAPEDIEKSESALSGLVGDGPDSVSFEKRYFRPDKSIVWIRSNLARIEQPDGSNRFLKIVEDITEAKAAEAALVEAQEALRVRGEQFHTLADNIPVLAWMAYADGHIFWYNRRWYDYTGTSPETQKGWGWESVHDPDVLPQVVEEWKRSIATGEPFEMIFPLRAADGMFRPFLTRVVPIRDESGAIVRWFGTNVDVSDRIRAEKQLREEGHNLEILNSIGSALSGELDLERVVQMVTDAGVDLTGAKFGAFFYNVMDERGESYMLYTLSGADRSQFERFGMPRNTKVFAPTFGGEGIVRSDDITKDPRYGKNPPHNGMPKGHLPVRSYLAVPVVGRTGEVIGGLFFGHPEPAQFQERHERLMGGIAAQAAVAIDNARLFREAQREIEQRMKAEQALTALNETLESRVREEIDRRSRAEEALRQAQKMETVGQLSGGIAHDFNNLLQVIHGNLTLLQQSLPSDEAKWQRAVTNAITGTERSAALTRRLLAFSRRQPLDPRAVDINRLVADMSELLRRTLGETVKVEMDLAASAVIAEVDRNQLENSILNLAINARDAMPEGGILTIATAAVEIGDEFLQLHPDAPPGDYVRLTVADTGNGMDADTLSRAVEPFFTTKEVGRGTGLGLSMVYGFVRQSDGYFDLRSDVGGGTSVDLYLPRAKRAVEPEPEPKRHGLARGNGETILLCEDDPDVRRFSADSLIELGYKVIEAADADSALDLLRDVAPIDLLFTDVVLPGGKTGAELAREAREVQPGLKVLFTTGYARSALDETAIDAATELLPKPFSIDELSIRLRQMLR